MIFYYTSTVEPHLFEPRVIRTFPLGPLNLTCGWILISYPHLFETPAYSNFFHRSLESSNKWGSTVYIKHGENLFVSTALDFGKPCFSFFINCFSFFSKFNLLHFCGQVRVSAQLAAVKNPWTTEKQASQNSNVQERRKNKRVRIRMCKNQK